MDDLSHMIRQNFGTTVLGSGAVANQGYFQQCVLPPSLIPELATQLQRLSAQTDARNPDRIFRSVAQLGFLGKHERVTLAGPDAQCVLDNIGNVLQALPPPRDSPHIIDREEETRGDNTNHGDNFRHHDALAAVRKILSASEYVGVNQPHAIRREVSRGSTSTILSKITDEFDIAHAQVRVYAWKRRLLPSRSGNSTCDEFTVRIDIQPKLQGAPDRSPYLSIYLQQIRGAGRSSFIDPMIVARRAVPDSSPVFQTIKDGDFEGLMRLLQNGQASLWDCDSRGCSLINYANNYFQVEICKYLIQNGADVDCIEPDLNGKFELPMPLLRHNSPNRENYFEALDVFTCLLEAGADPTIGNDFSLLSLSVSVSDWPHEEPTAYRTLRYSREYVDTKSHDRLGHTLLLKRCFLETDKRKIVQVSIDSLITPGSTLNTRNRFGDTCLHLIWPCYTASYFDQLNVFLLTYYLLDLGADANAQNNLGKTPSDVVVSSGLKCLYTIWNLALHVAFHVKNLKVDDWEIKKKNLCELEGIELWIPPLPARDDLTSEFDWLERIWMMATGLVDLEDMLWPEVEEATAEEEEVEKAEGAGGTESGEVELTPKQPSGISYTLWDLW